MDRNSRPPNYNLCWWVSRSPGVRVG